MKELKPKVSIITICLNNKDSLEKTIESVIKQTYKNIEYILIDGGSTDGTIEIIRRYEKNIDRWISEPDKGISDAFNKGINLSTGEFVGIINAGDSYVDSAVEESVKVLYKYPDFDFVYGDMAYTDNQGIPKYLMKADRDYLSMIHYTLPALNHPTIFVRKNVYETCGFYDPSYKIAMDYEFFLRITCSGKKGKYIEKPIAFMALGGTSYSHFYDGYKEVRNASVRYGYSPKKARIRLYLKGMRGGIRVILEFFRLNKVIKILQRIFWNIEDYRFFYIFVIFVISWDGANEIIKINF